MELKNITRRPAFWITQLFICMICTYLAVHFYPKAFPMVNLDIKMDRQSALKRANEIAIRNHWEPAKFRQAISFDVDEEAQNFIELTEGGNAAFSRVLKSGLYSFYTWRVRHFAENRTGETEIQFTPRGQFYGFDEKLPETLPGPALSITQALSIAEASAIQDWGVPLKEFKLVEKSHEIRSSHRVDHTFIYERPNDQLGEGRYRLKLVVSGNRLTTIENFIKIPETFSRRYAEMRSANNTISSVASIAMAIFYLLGGCGMGLFFLARKRWVIWKTPMLCAFIVAAFQLFEQINQLPLAWMNYDTALSSTGFLLQKAASGLVLFLSEFILLTISFMAAESLSRRAFPQHPQLWRIWAVKNASSYSILGRTLGGYLSVGFFFAFVVIIYIFGGKYLGWWSPSDILFHPDSLATYWPWFTSISNSLHAGFWEESLFRAVPLASAALIGEKFGNRKKWIGLGFVLQVLIFAAAHANYPAQPSYARVVELIIPSCMFGGIYLLFGLLPGIILHFTFDAISFAMPLFAASTRGIWWDRAFVILVSLTPLWMILIARLRTGRWSELKPLEYNGGWKPKKARSDSAVDHKQKALSPLNPWVTTTFSVMSFICLMGWIFGFNFKNNALPLDVNRDQAITLSRKALEESGVHLTSDWKALATTLSGIGSEESFIWKTEGPERYQKLMGNYLPPPLWMVRFVRFNTSVEERAEEYRVYIAKKGELFRIQHELPEARKGVSLEQEPVRETALTAIAKIYGLNSKALVEVSSIASKLPARTDWLFVFSDPSIHLKSGDARIGVRIAGDQPISSKRFIFIPEEWSRNERNRENMLNLVKLFSSITLGIIFLLGMISALLSWTKKNLKSEVFFITFGIILFIQTVNLLNGIPSSFAQLSTDQPLFNQILTWVGFSLVRILLLSSSFALLLSYVYQQSQFSTKAQDSSSLTQELIQGFSIGILGVTLFGLTSQIFSSQLPSIGKISALDEYFPILSGFHSLGKWLLFTLIFSIVGLVSERLRVSRNHGHIFSFFFLFFFGFVLSGIEIQNISTWALQGLIMGFYFWLIYRYFIRSQFRLIPLAVCSGLMLLEWKQIKMQPYSGVTLHSLTSILLIGIASYSWYKYVSENHGEARWRILKKS